MSGNSSARNHVVVVAEQSFGWFCTIVSISSGHSTCILIEAPNAQYKEVNELQLSLVRQLMALPGTTLLKQGGPCTGLCPSCNGCHCCGYPLVHHYRLIQVFVGQVQPNHKLYQSRHWVPLTVVRTGTNFHGSLPPGISQSNAAFWSHSITEVTPNILSLAGITTERFKVFISYKRSDTDELAEQLFLALAKAGFDVFLDRFTIPPGVDFLERIDSELSDKSFLLILESSDYGKSAWVQHELNYAYMSRSGVFALHLPGATRTRQLPPGNWRRRGLKVSDFVGGHTQGRLVDRIVDSIVRALKAEHGRAIRFRRESLKGSLLAFLGRATCRTTSRNNLQIRARNKTYCVRPTPRPPRLSDFHSLSHYQADNAIVGPVATMGARRSSEIKWLSQSTSISLYDEGRMIDLASKINHGRNL